MKMMISKKNLSVIAVSVIFMTLLGYSTQQPGKSADFFANGLEGWKLLGPFQGEWKYENGILSATGKGSGWLASAKQYTDFELNLEFRLPPGGDGGVFLRGPYDDNPMYSAMEIQIIDDNHSKFSHYPPDKWTGAINNIKGPLGYSRPVTQPGLWHWLSIECVGSVTKVSLDGILLVSLDARTKMDKARNSPGLLWEKGYIGFQNDGLGTVEYRNIRITELSK